MGPLLLRVLRNVIRGVHEEVSDIATSPRRVSSAQSRGSRRTLQGGGGSAADPAGAAARTAGHRARPASAPPIKRGRPESARPESAARRGTARGPKGLGAKGLKVGRVSTKSWIEQLDSKYSSHAEDRARQAEGGPAAVRNCPHAVLAGVHSTRVAHGVCYGLIAHRCLYRPRRRALR
jgi:hypothetical protein